MSKDTLTWMRDVMQRKLNDVDPAGYVSLYEVETWRDVIDAHLRERKPAKAGVTDEIRAHASFVYRQTTEGDCNELGMLNALEAVAPMLTSVRVPDGWQLVPERIVIEAFAWENAQSAIGGPGTGEGESYTDCTLWVGDIDEDDGSKTHGIHLSCNEVPEEGSVTLAKFAAAPKRGEG